MEPSPEREAGPNWKEANEPRGRHGDCEHNHFKPVILTRQLLCCSGAASWAGERAPSGIKRIKALLFISYRLGAGADFCVLPIFPYPKFSRKSLKGAGACGKRKKEKLFFVKTNLCLYLWSLPASHLGLGPHSININ